MKPKPKPTTKPIDDKPELMTQNQLADHFHRDRRTVAKLLEHAKPAKTLRGHRYYNPDDVAELLRDVAPRGSSQSKKDALADEQIRKYKLANDAKEGVLIPRSEVCRIHTEILSRVRRLLEQKLINEYPNEVADIGTYKVRGYGRNLCDALMDEINKMGAMWKH